MFKISGKEIIIHCPFCDDALRPKASSHGHLYLSEEHPVFHCFRCNSSGTLVSLLISTDFDDEDIIRLIASFIKINFSKDYYKRSKRSKISRRSQRISPLNKEFKRTHPHEYKNYLQYLYSRTGNWNVSFKYLLSPILINGSLGVLFNNFNGSSVLIRYINDNFKRYQINKQIEDNLYYFQEFKDTDNTITIAEGPFDIINLDLYSDIFKGSYFVSINGKNYFKYIEEMIIRELLIGSYIINIIFDTEFKNKEIYLKKLNNLTRSYNCGFSGEIQVNGYAPSSSLIDDVSTLLSLESIGD